MSFCPKCGNNVGDAAFCSKCGSKIETDELSTIEQNDLSNNNSQMNQRIQAASELTKLYDYFFAKNYIFEEHDKEEKNYNYLLKQTYNGIATLLALSLTVAAYSLLLGISSRKISIVTLISGAIAVFFYIIYNKKTKEKKNKLNEIKNQLTKLEDELSDHYNAYGYCPIGIEYSNPRIIRTIADIIRAGRADSIKEAINIMLDDAHKTTMELQAILTTAAAQSAAKNSAVSAAFSVASFILK